MIEPPNVGSIIDRLHRADKRELIVSAEKFKQIRQLRNNIAHEYTQIELEMMFQQVLKICPVLLDAVQRVKGYKVPEI